MQIRVGYELTPPSATASATGAVGSSHRRAETGLSADAVLNDTGAPDPVAAWAHPHAVQDLREETLVLLLGSRCCQTDLLSEMAWSLFSESPLGWGRVQAICDFVHHHISFGYEHARVTKTAWEDFNERTGSRCRGCRDHQHVRTQYAEELQGLDV